jgi:hypothetical protein
LFDDVDYKKEGSKTITTVAEDGGKIIVPTQ